MSALPEISTADLNQRISARDREPQALANGIARALRYYPYYARVSGFAKDDDSANVTTTAQLIAAIDAPENARQRVSFTKVRYDAQEAARTGAVTRYSRTSKELPLHTDSSYMQRPHELVAFQMVVADDSGGETILATVDDILRNLDDEVERALREPVYRFADGRYPVIYGAPGNACIRFYQLQLEHSSGGDEELSDRHRQALKTLNEQLTNAEYASRFFLEPGEILFMNNSKVLHGRTGFRVGSPRLMYRVRLHVNTLQAREYTSSMPAPFDAKEVRRLVSVKKLDEAIARCEAHLKIHDTDVPALLLYGRALRRDGRHRDAEAPLRRAAEVAPKDPQAQKALGDLLLRLGKHDEAITVFRRHREIAPDSYGGGLALSALLREKAELPAAREILADVVRKHPYRIIRRIDRLRRTIVRIRGLHNATYGIIGTRKRGYQKLLQGGHFAVTHLLDEDPYNLVVFNVFEDNLNRIDPPCPYDLILNTISCPDLERDSLFSLARFCARHPDIPVINHPRGVIDTARERNRLRFAGIDGVEFPLTERLGWDGDDPSAMVDAAEALGFTYPIIARKAGSQTGLSVRRCDNADELREYFASAQPQCEYYLVQYSDYRASHGFFNKTRVFCIDGSYYPVANLFVDNWSVHSGDRYRVMDKHQWMQDEEQAFLTDPVAYLGSNVFNRFAKIKEIVQLDFFGIDFCRREDGTVFIFELNPAMRHNFDHADRFPYTRPHLERVSRAFEQMVKRRFAG